MNKTDHSPLSHRFRHILELEVLEPISLCSFQTALCGTILGLALSGQVSKLPTLLQAEGLYFYLFYGGRF